MKTNIEIKNQEDLNIEPNIFVQNNYESSHQHSSKRLLCILPQVTGGGAERFFINFIKYIDKSKYNLSVVLARSEGGFEHEIPQDIPVYILNQREISTKILAPTGPFRYVPALVKTINQIQPDAILSFGSLLNGSVTLAGKIANYSNPIVIIEAIHESSEIRQHSTLDKWSRSLFLRLTYPLASKIIAVSEGIENDLRENFNVTKNIQVIHYGVEIDKIRSLSQEEIEHPWLCKSREHKTIVACGRLVKQKGFKFLIEAMKDLADDVKLILIGDGEEKEELLKLINLYNLQKKVDLVGYKRIPYGYIAKADLFVMPSLWEGFGIILIEALALGVPIIAADCPTGPKRILQNGECGVLIPPGDTHSIVESIKNILEDDKRREKLKLAATTRSYDFSIYKSIESYLKVLF